MKQMAYARRLLGGEGVSKKQIALDSGYSPNVSNSIKTHIEDKRGFNNAMTKLAMDSNNLALAAMHEFKARGFKEFSNSELTGALNAIGNAWAKFNQATAPLEQKPSRNKLKNVVLQNIENQTFIQSSTETERKPNPPVTDVSPEADF